MDCSNGCYYDIHNNFSHNDFSDSYIFVLDHPFQIELTQPFFDTWGDCPSVMCSYNPHKDNFHYKPILIWNNHSIFLGNEIFSNDNLSFHFF